MNRDQETIWAEIFLDPLNVVHLGSDKAALTLVDFNVFLDEVVEGELLELPWIIIRALKHRGIAHSQLCLGLLQSLEGLPYSLAARVDIIDLPLLASLSDYAHEGISLSVRGYGPYKPGVDLNLDQPQSSNSGKHQGLQSQQPTILSDSEIYVLLYSSRSRPSAKNLPSLAVRILD